MSLKPRNWVLFSIMIILWGSNWSIMKMGLHYVQPVTFVLQRFAVSTAVLLPFSLIFRERIPRDRSTLVRLMVLCLIFVSVTLAQAIGLSNESSGVGAVLTYTQPLFVFLLAVPFLKERVTSTKISGAAIGFTGVFVLFINKTGSFTLNSAFIMLSGAFLWAIAAVYYKKFLSHVDPLITHFSQLSVGIVLLILLSLTGSPFTFTNDTSYLEILSISSIGALAIGNVLWFLLLKEEEATTISGSSLIVPPIAILFGWQLLGEGLSIESLLGSALTLGGVYLINIRAKKSAPTTDTNKVLTQTNPSS